MISISELRVVAPGQLLVASREMWETAARQHNGAHDLRARVTRFVRVNDLPASTNPIADRLVKVAELSFDSAHRYMRAAATALATLAVELAVAQFAVKMAKEDAARRGLRFDKCGIVDPRTSDIETLQRATGISALTKLALVRAITADAVCSDVLGDIAHAQVPMTPTVDVATLADAVRRNADARAAEGRADRLLPHLQETAARGADQTIGPIHVGTDVVTRVLDAFWFGGVDISAFLRLTEQAASGDSATREELERRTSQLRRLGCAELVFILFGDTWTVRPHSRQGYGTQ